MGAHIQLRLPLRAAHRSRGAGFLGLVASVHGSKTRPLFLTEGDAAAIIAGGARREAWGGACRSLFCTSRVGGGI
jgi:hypothetical protein